MSKDVHLPLDAGLARLLRQGIAPTVAYRYIGEMANAADPRDPHQLAQIPRTMVPVVKDELTALLQRARQASDPAADVLAGFLARELGITEGGSDGS